MDPTAPAFEIAPLALFPEPTAPEMPIAPEEDDDEGVVLETPNTSRVEEALSEGLPGNLPDNLPEAQSKIVDLRTLLAETVSLLALMQADLIAERENVEAADRNTDFLRTSLLHCEHSLEAHKASAEQVERTLLVQIDTLKSEMRRVACDLRAARDELQQRNDEHAAIVGNLQKELVMKRSSVEKRYKQQISNLQRVNAEMTAEVNRRFEELKQKDLAVSEMTRRRFELERVVKAMEEENIVVGKRAADDSSRDGVARTILDSLRTELESILERRFKTETTLMHSSIERFVADNAEMRYRLREAGRIVASQKLEIGRMRSKLNLSTASLTNVMAVLKDLRGVDLGDFRALVVLQGRARDLVAVLNVDMAMQHLALSSSGSDSGSSSVENGAAGETSEASTTEMVDVDMRTAD